MKNYLHVGAQAAVKINDQIWISCSEYNALCTFDLKTHQYTIQHIFEPTTKGKLCLHSKIVPKGNLLFCFPCLDNCIRIYDMENKTERIIGIPNNNCYESFRALQVNNIIYLVTDSNELLCFDMETENFVNDENINSVLLHSICDAKKQKKIFAVNANIFYLYNNDTQELFEINIKTGAFFKRVINLPTEIAIIQYVDDKLWFLPLKQFGIYSYDVESGELILYVDNKPEFFRNREILPYCKIVMFQEKLILLNYYGRNIKKIDKVHHRVECLDKDLEEESYLNDWSMYMEAFEYHDKCFIFPSRGRDILIYDKIGIKQVLSGVLKDDQYYKRLKQQLIEDNSINEKIYEQSNVKLNDFIESICCLADLEWRDYFSSKTDITVRKCDREC